MDWNMLVYLFNEFVSIVLEGIYLMMIWQMDSIVMIIGIVQINECIFEFLCNVLCSLEWLEKFELVESKVVNLSINNCDQRWLFDFLMCVFIKVFVVEVVVGVVFGFVVKLVVQF